MEIERKFLVDLTGMVIGAYPSNLLEQGYLSVDPVVRVRRDGDAYYLTYKSGHGLVRVEENLPLTKESYEHLLKKADGYVITKRRYRIPVDAFFDLDASQKPEDELPTQADAETAQDVGRAGTEEDGGHEPDGKTVELDVFEGEFAGMIVAEIEFPTKEAAEAFVMPKRFYKDVSFDPRYINSEMSRNGRTS